MNPWAEFLEREDCLLLLVDIQKRLLEPCIDPQLLVSNVSVLIDIAEILGIPVLASEHNPEKLGGFLPDLVAKVSQPRIFGKLEFSCLENEAILRAVQNTGRKTILLAGIEAHICICHTGCHALRWGFRVHVISDAISSRKKHDRRSALRRMARAGAVVSSTEMAIYELLNRAGTPEFRAALPTLKAL